MRQDPDVILVGELRDVETFEAAVHAAETGHLVFGTIHASSAGDDDQPHPRPVPAGQARRHPPGAGDQPQGGRRAEAASRASSRASRVPTNEIMIVNPTIRKLIVKGEDSKLPDAIRIGYQEGMVDFTENLRQLVERGDVDKATALEFAPNPEQLKMALKGIKVAAPGIL